MKKFDSYFSIRWMAAALMSAVILSACKHQQDEPTEVYPLLISANTTASRAATPLRNKYGDFGVWAWKTNSDASQSLVLGRAPAADHGTEYYTRLTAEDKWTYEYSSGSVNQYLRYWDPAATNYYFSAYAPYLDASIPLNTSHTITATSAGVSISAVSGNIAADAGIDWLIATWQRQVEPTLIDIDLITDNDYITANLNDVVPLAFHHILATTEFRLFSGSDGTVKLKNISITIAGGGTIHTLANYAAGAWTYQDSDDTDAVFSLSSVIDLSGTTKSSYYPLVTLLQLPQDMVGSSIKVTATTVDDAERTGTFILDEGWLSEKKYIYYLCIRNDEIILMDFSADDWIAGGDIDVSDPVVNW